MQGALLVATDRNVYRVEESRMHASKGLEGASPSCLAARGDRAWCGTEGGVFLSENGGASWRAAGLAGQNVTALAAGPTGLLSAGTEPSAVWRSSDGETWEPTRPLAELPSSSTWAFPPRPDTHHVRWIACNPRDPAKLYVAIEAGALVTTVDGGNSWRDRVAGGPYDTHELAIHPSAPQGFRVAAGDGYFESADGGVTWRKPRAGLEVGYFRSVAIDPGNPDGVIASAASGPFSAYWPGRADGRVYRRVGDAPWKRVTRGWPDPPSTIAPVLLAGRVAGEVWGADERGVHASVDGGESWGLVCAFPSGAEPPWALTLLSGR